MKGRSKVNPSSSLELAQLFDKLVHKPLLKFVCGIYFISLSLSLSLSVCL